LSRPASKTALYDQIGQRYTATRRADPRIAAAILDALGDAGSVVNVGAGAGAYEPVGKSLIAAEPSWHMIRQRSTGPAFVVQAAAEALPFQAEAFDAALAVLTLHHWTDWRRGLGEMQRVAKRVVVFAYEPSEVGNFWLTVLSRDRRARSGALSFDCRHSAVPRGLLRASRRHTARLRRWIPGRLLASAGGIP
jgi:SAM-dependent methyltransferase